MPLRQGDGSGSSHHLQLCTSLKPGQRDANKLISLVDADVIVIGAGPAGCAAAIRLVQAGYRVIALERKDREDGEDITSGEVLVPATQYECHELGVKFEGDWVLDEITGFRNVYPDLSWTYHPIPRSIRPFQVDRGGFNAALRKRLVEVGGQLVWNARVTDVAFRNDSAIAHTLDRSEVAARLIIDAGGRYAPSLRTLNLKSEDLEFSQIGVAVFFKSFEGTPLHTWDRHLYGVRGAMLSGSRIRPGLFRYILEADLAEKKSDRLGAIEFYEAIAKQHDPWLHQRIVREPRVGQHWSMAPLGYRVSAVARDRLLLVGDAAGYLSPITGQGNEFAMRTGRLAALATDKALQTGDLSAESFSQYVEGRKREVERQVDYVRAQLRILRDRDALMRASKDDDYRAQVFGPYGIPATERGSLIS